MSKENEMRIADVPQAAFIKKATKVPTKVVIAPDWEALYKLIEKKGFVIIECEESELRLTTSLGYEAPVVKAFNSWCHMRHKHNIKTKRIGATRWFVAL
jgi:hypothetical protein